MSRLIYSLSVSLILFAGGMFPGRGQVPAASTAPQQPPILKIFLKGTSTPVSPMLYGLTVEDINYGLEGGLYGELLRNRNLKGNENGPPINWTLFKHEGAADAEMVLTHVMSLTDKLNNSIELRIKSATADEPVGIVNEGYWGIPIKPSTTYHASFYARSTKDFGGTLIVNLQTSDGTKTFAKAETPALTEHWQKIEVTLTTDADAAASTTNRFIITAQNPGTIWFSLFSLTGPTFQDQPNGFRPDLMDKLGALKPTFLKFPGGNNVQGIYPWDRFDWKSTRGPLFLRTGQTLASGYRCSGGMGLLEFMKLCEDLSIEPVLTVFSGLTSRQQVTDPGPLLDPYIADTLDELDYLMGDAKTSYWGSLRAQDGHPDPFKLNFLEIGNDEILDKTTSYDERLGQYFDAIKPKYPNLKLIASMSTQSRAVDYIDEHYYGTFEKIQKDYHHYDSQDRKGPKILVGAWADKEEKLNAREGAPTPTFKSALGDAIWMIGMERNSDLVAMSCYAPLLVNVNKGAMQVPTSLIGYDGLTSYGSPSYHAQLMFANHVGDIVPSTELKISVPEPENPGATPKKTVAPTLFLPYNVTRDTKSGKIYVKIVNKAPMEQKIRIMINGDVVVSNEGVATTLHADSLDDTNTITDPIKIVPVITPLSDVSSNYSYVLLPQSITVLEFTAN